MSMIQSDLLLGQEGGGGYEISRSLRFNSIDSAYLSRTPASAGNRKTWTWAGWVKRSQIGVAQEIFGAGVPGLVDDGLALEANGTLTTYTYSGSLTSKYTTTQVLRDFSAWYHIVWTWDSTNATAADRSRLYINGSRVTAFSISTAPSSSVDSGINDAVGHNIGREYNDGSGYFSGYLADIHFIDGQALTPSSFTEVSATTGQLIPKAYTGSFGTNGFRLPFSDNSTAAALGTDTSGNGNNWTVNNLSVTAGAGNDSLVDVPTSSGTDNGNGGEIRGNYCTWNPLDNGGGTLSNGNLDFSNLNANHKAVRSTIQLPASGKFYAELTVGNTNSGSAGVGFGFATSDASLTNDPANTGKWTIYLDGIRSQATNVTSSLGYFAANDVLQIAYDGATGKAWVGKNNVWYNSTGGTTGDPANGSNPTFTLTSSVFPYCSLYNNTCVFNAGARPFAYTAPSGFKALCTANLPAPVVTKPSTVMDVALYTGNGGNQSITLPGGFNPDLVWVKSRSNSQDHYLFDAIRGGAGILRSNTTGAETTGTTYLSFDTSGFSSLNGLSTNNYTYAAWCWDAGSSTVTNTQGSISSQVRANASAGFSIVTYTGTGSNATVGHGLGVAPAFMILKVRNNGSYQWPIYHSALSNPQTAYVYLNRTDAVGTYTGFWNSTNPSSTVFSLGTDAQVNGSGNTYVAYCFAPVAGYSSFGSYTGNGSTDGPFVYTGHRSRWIMIRKSSNAGSWIIWDSARDTYNYFQYKLAANLSSAENDAATIGYTYQETLDSCSNGFKLRSTNQFTNTNGETYIYYAVAESPFQYARAR